MKTIKTALTGFIVAMSAYGLILCYRVLYEAMLDRVSLVLRECEKLAYLI
ncbi:hypothetical protein PDESU_01335 [Pontiella desulfatans]|uniref:Uncharacterized protein n=1 Tax=Pontiella desulfatans TaxID=2750659 RepID=A0A6C2TZJ8_PONDE|nr:hypothetical protein [Pontiella desulfatans]VGO12781.1 hypothetical protein PDESU_01335 [Pontiella desulfatans]